MVDSVLNKPEPRRDNCLCRWDAIQAPGLLSSDHDCNSPIRDKHHAKHHQKPAASASNPRRSTASAAPADAAAQTLPHHPQRSQRTVSVEFLHDVHHL